MDHQDQAQDNLVIVYRALSILERDALVNELYQHGIEAIGAERDISRKIANSTIDLAFEGYSATMGGFPITVQKQDVEAAKKIIQDFINRINSSGNQTPTTGYLKKFYISSIYSSMLPLVFHAVGIYNLWKGLKGGEKIKPIQFIGALLLYIASGFLGFSMLRSWIVGT